MHLRRRDTGPVRYFIGVRTGVKPGQWGWGFDELVASWRAAEDAGFDELVASWRAAEDAGFDVVSCFDHVSAAPAGLAAWNAPSLLIAMAGVTERIALAVDVLNVSLRHPFLLAGQLAIAQAASDGRLEVGLGAGSYHLARFDHRALGVPFPSLPERRRRLARCCELLPALWRGEEVTDAELGLDAASLGPLGIEPPPLVVGGTSDETMTIAATFADGWNASVADAATFGELSARVDGICRRLARQWPLGRAAQVFVRDVELAGARQLVAQLEAAGADAVTFILVEERGADAVRALADAVL
jgi:alkanesulfonate monooxygenase SsuD/methylene tetrahydromethanopterin reductase-like flavin-dependent oxidoreductase (luciferase family)